MTPAQRQLADAYARVLLSTSRAARDAAIEETASLGFYGVGVTTEGEERVRALIRALKSPPEGS